MLKISVVTLFPEMFDALQYGVIKKAFTNQSIQLTFVNPRDHTDDKHNTVDDKPYGGGPGMILKPEPLGRAISAAKEIVGEDSQVIYLSPKGKYIEQPVVKRLSDRGGLILLCGRYQGIDQRIIDQMVDLELSIGDFILSGGEIPAMALIDAIARLMPETLGNTDSLSQESFSEGLLEHPQYTRPSVYKGQSVPEVLLGGDHGAIARHRKEAALELTCVNKKHLVDNK